MINKFFRKEDGQGLAEYSIIVGVIVAVSIFVTATINPAMANRFSELITRETPQGDNYPTYPGDWDDPENDEPAGDILTYEIDPHTKTWHVTGCTNDCPENVIIPTEKEGTKVTGIAKNAFYADGDIKTITFNENTNYIGEASFKFIDDLTIIESDMDIFKVEEEAFDGVGTLNLSATFKEKIQYVGESAFDGVTINFDAGATFQNLETIKEYGFANTDISEIFAFAHLDELEQGAFHNANFQTSVAIISTVNIGSQINKSIGAFEGATISGDLIVGYFETPNDIGSNYIGENTFKNTTIGGNLDILPNIGSISMKSGSAFDGLSVTGNLDIMIDHKSELETNTFMNMIIGGDFNFEPFNDVTINYGSFNNVTANKLTLNKELFTLDNKLQNSPFIGINVNELHILYGAAHELPDKLLTDSNVGTVRVTAEAGQFGDVLMETFSNEGTTDTIVMEFSVWRIQNYAFIYAQGSDIVLPRNKNLSHLDTFTNTFMFAESRNIFYPDYQQTWRLQEHMTHLMGIYNGAFTNLETTGSFLWFESHQTCIDARNYIGGRGWENGRKYAYFESGGDIFSGDFDEAKSTILGGATPEGIKASYC